MPKDIYQSEKSCYISMAFYSSLETVRRKNKYSVEIIYILFDYYAYIKYFPMYGLTSKPSFSSSLF